MKKLLSISCYLWLLCLNDSFKAFSQDLTNDTENKRYLFLGVGFTGQTLQDPAVSPMTYSGGPVNFTLGYEKHKPKLFSSFQLSGDIGAMQSDNATELRPMRSSVYRIDLQYTYLRRTHFLKSDKYTLWLGGRYLWHNSIRLTPQNDTGFISFLIANSLKASGLVHRDVQFRNKQFSLRYGLDLALLSHVVRPNYLNIFDYLSPENDWVGERLEDSHFYTFNKFPNINSTLSLDYPIAGGNLLRFNYQWEFYHLNTSRRVNYGRHLFLFSFIARI